MNRLLLPLVLMAISSLITTVYSAGTIRVVDITLPLDCTANNYNEATRDCTGSYSSAYNTIQEAVDLMAPGDTTYLRGGTYPTTARIDLQLTNKSGSAGAYMTFSGFPGDSKPVLQYSEGDGLYGNIKARGNRGWFIFQDLVLDGANLGNGTYWAIRDGNHDIIVRRVEVKNTFGNGIYFDNVNNITVEDSYFHDSRSDCVVGNRWHGFYIHHGTNVVLQRNKVEAYHGIGFQLFPGPWDGVKIKDSVFYNNNHCVTVNNGGAAMFANSGNIANVEISGNVIAHNGYAFGGQPGGAGGGLRILVGGGFTFSNVVVDHNTIVDNTYNPDACTNTTTCVDHERGNAISILSGVTGITFTNNLVTSNTDASVVNYGTGLSFVNHACKSGESCGSTGKVTVTDALSCIVSLVTPDYRLKQGTNPCRDAGTTSTARPAPVTSPDIGAYEQPVIASASVVSNYLEVTINAMTPGVLPTTGLTGFSVACVGCTGSPSVVSANVKSGTNNIVHLAIAGLSASGSCTVSLGSTTGTDSLFIGGPVGTAQGLNSASAVSVSGTCVNTGSGGVTPPTASWSHFPFSEGTGVVANDDTGNGHHGSLSGGISWVNDASGTGIYIPSTVDYRQVSSTYGSGINPSTQDFAGCALVKPDVTNSQKVVFSSTTNGTGQRWYAGWTTASGQLQWGIGIQGSGLTTGSEFVVTGQLTLICLVNDSSTDTATLWVNGVKGAGIGTSVKSLTSYTLTGNLIAGNDGTNTVNNGGFTLYEFWVWNTKPTDQNMLDLYNSFFPSGATVPCMSQAALQWQRVYTDGSAPMPITAKADGSVDVVANGGVAAVIQMNCTGSNGGSVSIRPYYSTDGVSFSLPVPQTVGAGNIGMWGSASEVGLNSGTISTCVNDAGLTQDLGVTVLDATTSPTISMLQNHCQANRWIFRVGASAGSSLYIRLISDPNGLFANGYAQTVKLNIVDPASSGAY